MDGDRIPGYDELTDIGGGGFSRVYRANDLNNFRTVAIKVLNPTDVTDEQRKAFDRERKAMATVGSHPHVVQLLDSDFTEGGRPYIVMPFYENGTFADRIRDGQGLAASEVLDVGVKIASALHIAHEHNIVHRDIKPSNIFQGDFGQHALADFGISSFSAQHTAYTNSVEVALSPSHSAPEVLDDERPSVQTDVYMLGSTLYTLLTGKLAFPGESLGAVVRKILSQPPPPITVDAPDTLKSLIGNMLAKDPKDRPQTARDVAETLHGIQVASGLTPTKISVKNLAARPPESSEADSESFDPDATTVFGRMATVQPGETYEPEMPQSSAQFEVTADSKLSTPDRRGLAKPAALLAALVLAAVVIWGFTRNDPELVDPSDTVTNPVDPDDALPILPTTPTNIVLTERLGEGFEVTWTAAAGPDTTFELRQVGSDKTASTELTMLTVELDPDHDPCVQLRTVRASRLSEWSDQVCAGE